MSSVLGLGFIGARFIVKITEIKLFSSFFVADFMFIVLILWMGAVHVLVQVASELTSGCHVPQSRSYTGGCKLASVGAGHQSRVICKNSR